ncbi:MAG: patatin-like phospholipase RssA [Shewanella sp.]|nr:patatin-like phospholipase RssA [Shewanella sp.]MCF1429728.1 patatin-like phospholipase RssA [Shewanella sp.]MCF1457882.1 patatin-like phospholipase RssA [Shewanella sp.]
MTIGLALGSGAAKGWAHIGVLNGLAKLGIYPDKVAGCSVGALVGAAYANDNLDELENWVRGFSQWDVLGLLDLSWRKGGLIGGERVFNVLESHIGDVRIEDLKLPFTAVATDLYSGQEIWFSEGELRHAVRASCSMPGILSPVKQGERWLVDGAVVNPVPVSVARAMDVDVVVAVDLSGERRRRIQAVPVSLKSEPLTAADIVKADAHSATGFTDLLARGREYLLGLTDVFGRKSRQDPGMLAVMSQSMDILEQRHKRARLMGDLPDVCILPRVGDIGIMEFHRAEEAIAAGEQAVLSARHQIELVLGL